MFILLAVKGDKATLCFPVAFALGEGIFQGNNLQPVGDCCVPDSVYAVSTADGMLTVEQVAYMAKLRAREREEAASRMWIEYSMAVQRTVQERNNFAGVIDSKGLCILFGVPRRRLR